MTITSKQLELINQLLKDSKTMAIDFTALTNEVANQTTIDASVITLVNGLAAQIVDAVKNAADLAAAQAQVSSLAAQFAANNALVAAAVAANTPAEPAPNP